MVLACTSGEEHPRRNLYDINLSRKHRLDTGREKHVSACTCLCLLCVMMSKLDCFRKRTPDCSPLPANKARLQRHERENNKCQRGSWAIDEGCAAAAAMYYFYYRWAAVGQ